MSETLKNCRVAVLVKALPQRSARHGETVCCAGVTVHGQWKRLYPVRFRHLDDEKIFRRWDFVSFRYGRPPSDSRAESCRVYEESIVVDGRLAKSERADFLEPLVMPSVKAVIAAGRSLALIRPIEPRFFYRSKSRADLEDERQAYRDAVAQKLMFDEDLTAMEPTPYELKFRFKDVDAQHEYTSGDWEAHTMFFAGQRRLGNDAAVLE